ncbi:hypothetical protein HYX58_02840 [Candidatus Dependentiae bacterium]|nr:hypothetical protein [Candidatus Dependentiae bacterium]
MLMPRSLWGQFLFDPSHISYKNKIIAGCVIAFLGQKGIEYFAQKEQNFRSFITQFAEHLAVCKKFNETFPGTMQRPFEQLKKAHDQWDQEVLKSQKYFLYGNKKYTNSGIIWKWQFPPHIYNSVEWECLMDDPKNVHESFFPHESFQTQFVPVIQKNEKGERFVDLTIRKSCAKDRSIKSVAPYLWLSRAFLLIGTGLALKGAHEFLFNKR